MLTVVAALIESGGKILSCQRRSGGRFGLMWEFPGGKLEPGEAPAEALRRELREELGVAATIGPEIYRTRHEYAEMSEPLDLIFFAATANPEQMRNLIFEKIEWRTPESLPELDFLPADRELIEKIANGTLRIKSNSPTG
jgi:8-oxo-dGTP diphosphatase